MGSVHYFSPEQAKGKLATEQSDLYSLGIVFYEMLTKQLPFDGESPISIALKHLQQTIPPASKYNLNVTANLQQILDKLLEKDRSQRYQSVTDLLAALRTWNAEGAPGAHTHEHGDDLDTDSQHTQVYAPVQPQPEKKKPWQTKLIKWTLICVVLGAVIYLGVLGIRALSDVWRVEEVQVPDVTNLSLEAAIAQLESVGLTNYQVINHVHHETIPENHVVNQKPSADQTVKEHRLIELTISKGPDLVEVPPLVGKEVRVAEEELRALGLQAEKEYEFSDEPYGTVIRQEPVSGKIPRSQKVRLVVSEGVRPIIMESLVGKTLAQALTIIGELMLEDRVVRWEPAQGSSPGGIVTSHNPEARSEVRPGDKVDLWVRPFNRITHTVTLGNLAVGSQVRIEVTDITGDTNVVFDDFIWEEEFSQSVSGWEKGTIVVYVNGAKEKDFDF